MNIAVIGFGGVGRAFMQLIEEKKEMLIQEGLDAKICYIMNSSGGVYNPEGIDCMDLLKFSANERDISKYPKGGSKELSLERMLKNKDVDVLVEMTPTNKKTGEPGMTHITKSLESGIHVITSNKGPLLLAYKKLNDLAVKNGVQLGIGCTTGGALPSINGGMMDLAGSEILSIEGVLNGTTNFIINEMENKKVDYQEALKEAQKIGIAETDPTLDVEGWDTASKLLILTNVLMNEDKTLEDISVEGITKIKQADVDACLAEGKKFKLVGKTVKKDGQIIMSVRLERLDSGHSLYGVDGKNKAVRYGSDGLGDLTIIGGASGVRPAGASVLRDLINIHRGYKFSR